MRAAQGIPPPLRAVAAVSAGPLRPGDVGVIAADDSSDVPFSVRAPDGRTWWYMAQAVQLASAAGTTPTPAPAPAPASTGRPTTGDRVSLTADFASHGDAADGEWS